MSCSKLARSARSHIVTNPPTTYDVFLSHGAPDKAWVRTLADELKTRGLSVFLDEQELQPGQNFVLGLSDGLRASRALVLVLSRDTCERPWVEREWTAYLAEHGPKQFLVPVLLEETELPTILKPIQTLPALHRDATRVADQLATVLGGDARQPAYLGSGITFVVRQAADADDSLEVVGSDGLPRTMRAPWKESREFGIAWLSYRQLTREPVDSDAQRIDVFQHARTLGSGLFELLFGSKHELALLAQATVPGERPIVTIRSDDDFLLSLPWELLHDGDRFLVGDAVVDMARSGVEDVGVGSLLKRPTGPFRLVTNVSAPEGSGLSYEAESYRITRALSEQCPQFPTELGTLDDLVETVVREKPTRIHFSGHGAPGRLVFEDELGQEDPVPITRLVEGLRAQVEGGGLPSFFYLASCHGNTAASTERSASGSESSAAQLYRAGVAEVVGYYGPIADELSTRAEVALYRAIAAGETTRTAVRRALTAMKRTFDAPDATHKPDGTALEPTASRTPATEVRNLKAK
jgi:hypothetical protein